MRQLFGDNARVCKPLAQNNPLSLAHHELRFLHGRMRSIFVTLRPRELLEWQVLILGALREELGRFALAQPLVILCRHLSSSVVQSAGRVEPRGHESFVRKAVTRGHVRV